MVVMKDGDRLAGSALRMDRAIENAMRRGGATLVEALTMASRNAARVGRIPGRQRGLAAGERADVVEYEYDAAAKSIKVLRTYISGELVYSAN
jgi:N-acetylglucosamine-6-phosphate deacetylase